ncbi:GGDEF domain-containing protein, partial [Mesorhizobium sp. M00.F.Ca.ET.149.01.1.1]
MGSFILGLWGLRFGFGDGMAGIPAETMAGMIAALCALAAGGAALSFFAGVDESVAYVVKETHFDKLTGLLSRQAMVGRIADAASSTIRTGEPVFLIDIHIDRFKQINEAIVYRQVDE